MRRYIIIGIGLLLMSLTTQAQRFFNLTAEQVRIDSLLPVFTHHVALGQHYADSTYSVAITYPEFIPMSEADVQRYLRISKAPLPAMPEIMQATSVDRKQGELTVSFVPLVYRDGQYQKLVPSRKGHPIGLGKECGEARNIQILNRCPGWRLVCMKRR